MKGDLLKDRRKNRPEVHRTGRWAEPARRFTPPRSGGIGPRKICFAHYCRSRIHHLRTTCSSGNATRESWTIPRSGKIAAYTFEAVGA